MNRLFYNILFNTLMASTINTFVWFAVTFWAYLQTGSVIVTSVMAGVYMITVALSGVFLGSLVDRYRKKASMMISSIASLLLYALAFTIYTATPAAGFTDQSNPRLWLFIIVALAGVIVGNLRSIALSTLVTILIPETVRDRANGMVGTANGVAFLIASILSGLAIGFLGMYWMLLSALGLTLLLLVHLALLNIPEKEIVHVDGHRQSIDIRGSIRAIQRVPGLFGLIFFQTINNFLGGVFMSLMDPYGLELVSVQVWGTLWGFLSLGFIVGGLIVAKRGLGNNPLRALFLTNIVTWTVCCFFAVQASIVLLTVGMFIFLCLMPIIEAAEQTILQRVVPPERQGRVFGLAQSIEQSASPLTAFVIGPVAQLIFIPFMTTGAGIDLVGNWFGTGVDRGIALIFILTGLIGLIVTILSMQSKAYKTLSTNYMQPRSGTGHAPITDTELFLDGAVPVQSLD